MKFEKRTGSGRYLSTFLLSLFTLFLTFNCGSGSEEIIHELPGYRERLDRLLSSYDDEFLTYLNDAQTALGKNIVSYQSISDEFTVPKFVRIQGSHYEYGFITGYIANRFGTRLLRVSDSERELNARIIRMYETKYPQYLELVRGVSVIYNIPVEDLDFQFLEDGFFNELWYRLLKYPEFENLTPPDNSLGTSNIVGNCAVVSAKVGNDVHVGRNFDNNKVRPTFVMRTKMDGVYEVLSNASYTLYQWVMDGINEKGLVMATAGNVLPDEYYNYNDPYPSEPAIQKNHLFRVALETCSTVDEVIDLYRSVRVWIPGVANHLMVIDAAGNSAVIELGLDRRPVIFRSHEDYQVMTNTALQMGEEYLMQNCRRYRTATQMGEQGITGLDDVKRIMREIRGPAYGYMSLFDIKSGMMRVVPRHDWDIELDYYINIR